MNTLYPLYREAALTGSIDWLGDDIRAVLLTDAYVYSDAHQFYSDLGGVIAVSPNLGSKTVASGVADAEDALFVAVAAGPPIEAVVVYHWTGVAGTSRLAAFYSNDASSSAISVTPIGSDVLVRWSNGALRMFRL